MSDPIVWHGEIISQDKRSLISDRYHTITRAINIEFRGLTSDTANSFYVGSYGRGTAINTSDLDVLVVLPETEYNRYDNMNGNGQSRLLQAVRKAIQRSYPISEIRADGQVVKVAFSDNMKFEVLPAFENKTLNGMGNSTYKYPDSNMGGNWLSTDPKAEQEAMKQKNEKSNDLLFDTCKHIRYIRDNHFKSYHLPGIIIDSFVYTAIGDWHWSNPNENANMTSSSEYKYEKNLCNYLWKYKNHSVNNLYAPGSRQKISFDDDNIEILDKIFKYILEQ